MIRGIKAHKKWYIYNFNNFKEMDAPTKFNKEAKHLLLQLVELQSIVERLIEQNKDATYLRNELKACLAAYSIALTEKLNSFKIDNHESIEKSIDYQLNKWLAKHVASHPQSMVERKKRTFLESITQEIGHLLYVKSLFNRPRDIAKLAEELLLEAQYQQKNNLSGIHFLTENSYWYEE